MNNAAAEQLANGQVGTEVDRIMIDDQNGDTVTQDVAITITGTNDEALVSGAAATGAVVEDGTASAVGTAYFTDVDLTDYYVVSSALQSTDYTSSMGTFTAVETADTTCSGSGGGELELRDQQRRGAAAGQRPGGD